MNQDKEIWCLQCIKGLDDSAVDNYRVWSDQFVMTIIPLDRVIGFGAETLILIQKSALVSNKNR